MKRRMMTVVAILVGSALTAPATTLLPSDAHAKDVRVESDALFDSWMEDLSNRQEFLNESVRMIRQNGWRCDSISAGRGFVFSRGYSLICNRYNYEYEIEDRGGHWVVTLK